MNLSQLLDYLKQDESFMENVTCWRTIPKREAVFAPFPEGLDGRIAPALAKHHITQLYAHQADAFPPSARGRTS